MTKQEFIERVNVNVTNEEYEHIEAVYMASDVDKDTFCKMWVKMNKTRVEAAKTIAAKKEQFMQDLMFVYDMNHRNYRHHATIEEAYSEKEIARLEKLGIDRQQYAYEVVYETQQLLDKMIEELKKAA